MYGLVMSPAMFEYYFLLYKERHDLCIYVDVNTAISGIS